VVEVLSIDFTQ